MRIYLASGYSVMNIPNREEELCSKFDFYRRLISYHDLSVGNKIINVINVNNGTNKEK